MSTCCICDAGISPARPSGKDVTRWCDSLGRTLTYSPSSASDIAEALDRRALGPDAKASELSHIRGFFRWAVDRDLIARSPAEAVERPRLHRRLPRPMPDGDLAMAIEAAPEHLRLALMVAAYAGLRACEISGLRGEHVLLEQTPPVLLIEKSKGGDMQSVHLAPVLAGLLALQPRSGWLFPRRDGNPGPWPPWRVSQATNAYLHSMGITHTLHTCRHWFGTNGYRATGRDVRATQELLRHASIASTMIYTWVDRADLAAAVARLPVLTNWQEPLFR